MTEHRELFLSAEEQANRLVAQLQALKTEVENYGEAKSSLEGVQQLLSGLVPEIAQAAGETRQVIKELGKIGTPEILENTDRISGQLVTIDKDLRSASKSIADNQAASNAILGSRLDRLERFVWVLIGMGGLVLALLAALILRVF